MDDAPGNQLMTSMTTTRDGRFSAAADLLELLAAAEESGFLGPGSREGDPGSTVIAQFIYRNED